MPTEIKKLKFEDFTIKQTVGTGSFGRVKLIQRKSDGQYLALKIMKKEDIIKLKQVDHILSEITILNAIDHPRLVKMHGIMQNERYLYRVLRRRRTRAPSPGTDH